MLYKPTLLLIVALSASAQSFKFEGEETPKPIAVAVAAATKEETGAAAAAAKDAVDFGEVQKQGEDKSREARKIQGERGKRFFTIAVLLCKV